jgi:hypothetical protein
MFTVRWVQVTAFRCHPARVLFLLFEVMSFCLTFTQPSYLHPEWVVLKYDLPDVANFQRRNSPVTLNTNVNGILISRLADNDVSNGAVANVDGILANGLKEHY